MKCAAKRTATLGGTRVRSGEFFQTGFLNGIKALRLWRDGCIFLNPRQLLESPEISSLISMTGFHNQIKVRPLPL